MPRNVGSNSVLEVTFVAQYQGQRILNVFHYRWTTLSPTSDDGDAIVNAAIDYIQGDVLGAVEAYRDMTVQELFLERVRYQWIYPFRWSFVSSTLRCGVGRTLGTGLPSNVGITAQKVGEYPGPAGRGSTHITGSVVEALEFGVWNAEYKTKVGVFMSQMDNPIPTTEVLSGSVLNPIIYHKAEPALSAPWKDAFVHPEPRVMYRRTLRVGE